MRFQLSLVVVKKYFFYTNQIKNNNNKKTFSVLFLMPRPNNEKSVIFSKIFSPEIHFTNTILVETKVVS